MKFIALTIVVSHLFALSAPCPAGVATAPAARSGAAAHAAAMAIPTAIPMDRAMDKATGTATAVAMSQAGRAETGHAHHGQHVRHADEQAKPVHRARHCEEGQPDTMQAKCPCGCGGLPYTSGSSARLGYGLFPATDEPLPEFFRTTPIASAPRFVIAPSLATDHVPILFQLV